MTAPNLQQAQSFLTALDEDSDAWSFQTFDDGPKKSTALIRQFHGSLEHHAADLVTLNDRGAGIFVTINETNGKGRKKADITRIRALFVDLDGSPLGPVQNAANEPHIVVESSPGRYHAYWRVNDCGIDQCEPALKQLIKKFDADKSCCDRSRVLRLPGFYHRKSAPYQVKVIATAPGEYRMDDFGFSLNTSLTYRRDTEEYFSHLLSSSVGVPPNTIPSEEGQRNRCLFALARFLRGTRPNATTDELRSIVREWHALAKPTISSKEFSVSWMDFTRGWDKVTHPYGETLTSTLKGIDDMALPTSLASFDYGEKTERLILICRQLQRQEGDKPFFISARQAGELVDLHFTDASKALGCLVYDGILELVKKGGGNQASRYRYVWPD